MGSLQVERTDAHGDHEPEMRKCLEINERMFRFMERGCLGTAKNPLIAG